eukprot:scaffold32730_cov36-Cyclotella_meneghiniana.AAC.3
MSLYMKLSKSTRNCSTVQCIDSANLDQRRPIRGLKSLSEARQVEWEERRVTKECLSTAILEDEVVRRSDVNINH